jgi:hypothetical protein
MLTFECAGFVSASSARCGKFIVSEMCGKLGKQLQVYHCLCSFHIIVPFLTSNLSDCHKELEMYTQAQNLLDDYSRYMREFEFYLQALPSPSSYMILLNDYIADICASLSFTYKLYHRPLCRCGM